MTSRRRSIVFVIVGAAVLLGVIALLFQSETLARQQRDVADPPSDATPEQVVRTFMDALDAHDCTTARRVWVSDDGDEPGLWCADVASLTNVSVSTPIREPSKDSGRRPGEQVVGVAVRFDLRWRPFHNDGSMDEGPTTWGYELVRASSHGAWRIFSQGEG